MASTRIRCGLAAITGDDFIAAVAVQVGGDNGAAVYQGSSINTRPRAYAAVNGYFSPCHARSPPGIAGGSSRLSPSLEPDFGHAAGSPGRFVRVIFRRGAREKTWMPVKLAVRMFALVAIPIDDPDAVHHAAVLATDGLPFHSPGGRRPPVWSR